MSGRPPSVRSQQAATRGTGATEPPRPAAITAPALARPCLCTEPDGYAGLTSAGAGVRASVVSCRRAGARLSAHVRPHDGTTVNADNLIFIIGGSGTGKTTLARELQERLLPEQWFHFSPDTLLYGLPKSLVDRADLVNDWSAIDQELINTLAYGLVRNALHSGGRVVFDCVHLLTSFATSNPFLVGTTCAWKELVRRTSLRGDRTLAEVQRGFEMSGQFLDVDCVLDTSAKSPAQLVDDLLEGLANQVGTSAWQRNLARYQLRREA
jgi:chloramphenicol 3-O-phosphotransferase